MRGEDNSLIFNQMERDYSGLGERTPLEYGHETLDYLLRARAMCVAACKAFDRDNAPYMSRDELADAYWRQQQHPVLNKLIGKMSYVLGVEIEQRFD